jgi:hypothetical protein
VSKENYYLQILSTIRIMAFQFGISDNDLKLNFDSINPAQINQEIKKIFGYSIVRQNKQFRAALALMMLRRKIFYTKNSLFANVYLIFIASYSDPFVTFKSLFRVRSMFRLINLNQS